MRALWLALLFTLQLSAPPSSATSHQSTPTQDAPTGDPQDAHTTTLELETHAPALLKAAETLHDSTEHNAAGHDSTGHNAVGHASTGHNASGHGDGAHGEHDRPYLIFLFMCIMLLIGVLAKKVAPALNLPYAGLVQWMSFPTL